MCIRDRSDLYILPSSVHEVIAVSSDMGSPEMLAQMVVEVNMQEVSLDERLSNQVYHYDKDLRKLTLATDTPVSYTHLDVYKRQIASMLLLETDPVFYISYDGVYTTGGTDYYEFRCHR